MSKTCGTCQRCCDGTYTDTINGHVMGNGKPCYFLAKDGCSIYEDRPEKPCKEYKCLWLEYDEVPDFMKPENSGALIDTRSGSNGRPYVLIEGSESSYSAEVFFYAMEFAQKRNMPLAYKRGNGFSFMGNKEECDRIVLDWEEERKTFFNTISKRPGME